MTDGEEREGIPRRPRGKRAQTGLGQRQGAQSAWNMEQLGEQQEIDCKGHRCQAKKSGLCSVDSRARATKDPER